MTFKRSLVELLEVANLESSVRRLRSDVGPGRLECIPQEDPNDMDTIGSLVDKLVTVNLKMWHNQELLYAIRRMSTEEFEDRYEGSLDELHETIKRCCDLNVQRSKLMDAIDKLLFQIASGEREAAVFAQHKTY